MNYEPKEFESVSVPWHGVELNLDLKLVCEPGDASVGLAENLTFEDVYYKGAPVQNLRNEIYTLLDNELAKAVS